MSMRMLRKHGSVYDARMLTDEEALAIAAQIRDAVKTLRKTLKVGGQKQLERRSGVDQPTISRIENGVIPELPTLVKLIDGLGLSLSEFFLLAAKQSVGDKKSDAVTVSVSPKGDKESTLPTSGAIEHGASISAGAAHEVITVFERFERAIVERERGRALGGEHRSGAGTRGPKPVRRKPRH